MGWGPFDKDSSSYRRSNGDRHHSLMQQLPLHPQHQSNKSKYIHAPGAEMLDRLGSPFTIQYIHGCCLLMSAWWCAVSAVSLTAAAPTKS